MCVGYAGHNAFAELASLNVGNHTFAAGANCWSHNLTKKHRAQFRSGGFTVTADGHDIPLLPNISANLQMDGFRLWDEDYPFGLGRNEDGTDWGAGPAWSIPPSAPGRWDARCPAGRSGRCAATFLNYTSLIY